MKLFKARRNHSPGAVDSAGSGSPDEAQLPVAVDNTRDGKNLIPKLHELSQVDLVAVEAHERSHRDRPTVLNKLRYLRSEEPLPGYDALAPEAIAAGLPDASQTTVKAVREYERKLRGRRVVLDGVEQVFHATESARATARASNRKASPLAGLMVDDTSPPAVTDQQGA